MTYSPETVVSGVAYAVLTVHDRSPESLEDFTGRTAFRVEGLTGTHDVAGEGVPVGDAVRVHQKTPPDEKDVRPWTVRRTAEGTFEAFPQ